MKRSTGIAALAAALCLTVGAVFAPAAAAPLSAAEILQQFNLVTFGDLDSSSEVEGRTLVGGDLTGNSSTYFTRSGQVAPSEYGALTVGGSITGGYKNVNGNGNAYVAGNVQNMNMNGGTAYIGGSITGNVNGNKFVGVTVEVPDFRSELETLSANLATLAAQSAVNVSGNRATFTATPDSGGLAVFEILDGAFFFSSIGEIDFVLNGADSLIINVGGLGITIAENFLGGIGQQIASKTIWNFYEATEITYNAEFFGTVLAPNAHITNMNSLNGGVYVDRFTQRGEVHLAAYTGDIPNFDDPGPTPDDIAAPAGVTLLGFGLVSLAAFRRRRTV